jgi:chromosome segregation ATPase
MANQKSRAKPVTLDTVLRAVESGFAAAAEDIAEVKGDIAGIKDDISEMKGEIAHIKKTMVTKEDLHHELASIHAELKSIRGDLDDLIEKFENVAGFRKEIDHALERITAIEKHLGLDKKIAA